MSTDQQKEAKIRHEMAMKVEGSRLLIHRAAHNAQEGFRCYVRHSLNTDMSSATEVEYFYMQYDTRGGDDPPQQTAFNANGIANITTYTSSAIGTVIYFDVKKSTYGGLSGGYSGSQAPLLIRIQEIQQ